MPGGLENIIKYCKETGISSLELMSGDLEMFLGAPPRPNLRIPRGVAPTPEERAIFEQFAADLKAFRLGVTPAKVAAAKKLFDDVGIGVHIVKFSPARWSPEEIDYSFATTKAMGAIANCEEVGESAAKALAPHAEKHGMYILMHNHGQFAQPDFDIDRVLDVSPAVMLNFDVGHYYGSTGLCPAEFIKKYHSRIYSLHIKDKTGPETEPRDANQVWGQGETPLEKVMLLLKKEGWPIYADIELEYQVKPWSNAIKETRTCVQYLRNILI